MRAEDSRLRILYFGNNLLGCQVLQWLRAQGEENGRRVYLRLQLEYEDKVDK